MLIWVSVSWTPRSHRKVLLVSSRSHATGNSSRGASSWRRFITRALIVNAVSSPQGQKEKLGKFGSSGHSRQKAKAHRPSDVLSFRASHAANPAYDVRRELMDGIPVGAGGEGERVIPSCRQELSRALHRGSGTEISCKAEIPQTPGPSRCRSSGGGVSERSRGFSLLQPFPSAAPPLLLGVAHWVVQCSSPGPARTPGTSWAAKKYSAGKSSLSDSACFAPGTHPEYSAGCFSAAFPGKEKRRKGPAFSWDCSMCCSAQFASASLADKSKSS